MHEIESDLMVEEAPPIIKTYSSKAPVVSRPNWYVGRGKRICEILFICVIGLPLVFLVLIIAVFLLWPSKGRVFFKQQRIGINGRPFNIYKFRTLGSSIELDIEKDAGIIKSNSHPVGIFLRRTGFDEILQVVNVVRGEMSLIGPRPLLMNDLKHLSHCEFIKRHSVKPGIVGLWQVKRKYVDDRNYFRYDNFYIERQSPALDLHIMISTIVYVLNRRGR